MLRFCDYKEYLSGSICHGNSYLPTRYAGERQRQNGYLAAFQATRVSPYRPWGESGASLEFSVVFRQVSVVEMIYLI